jgi:SnoaL-like domain
MSEARSDLAQDLRTEIAELREAVAALSEREAIVDCLHRYSRGLDRRDWELMKSAFHDDGIDQHGNFIGSPQELVDWARELFNEWDFSVHFLDLNNLEIEGDVAHSECYVLFTQRRRDGQGLDFGGGRYLDRLERRQGEWRIAARQTVIDWSARAQTAEFADVASEQIGTLDRSDPSYQRPLIIQESG